MRFDGDPFQAVLNVNAIYKVNASLNDLDKNLAESTGQSTIPVNCVLNLTGGFTSSDCRARYYFSVYRCGSGASGEKYYKHRR